VQKFTINTQQILTNKAAASVVVLFWSGLHIVAGCEAIVVVVGCWLLVVGCWLLVVGCWLLFHMGCWLTGTEPVLS
jgi:hypothetical protein